MPDGHHRPGLWAKYATPRAVRSAILVTAWVYTVFLMGTYLLCYSAPLLETKYYLYTAFSLFVPVSAYASADAGGARGYAVAVFMAIYGIVKLVFLVVEGARVAHFGHDYRPYASDRVSYAILYAFTLALFLMDALLFVGLVVMKRLRTSSTSRYAEGKRAGGGGRDSDSEESDTGDEGRRRQHTTVSVRDGRADARRKHGRDQGRPSATAQPSHRKKGGAGDHQTLLRATDSGSDSGSESGDRDTLDVGMDSPRRRGAPSHHQFEAPQSDLSYD